MEFGQACVREQAWEICALECRSGAISLHVWDRRSEPMSERNSALKEGFQYGVRPMRPEEGHIEGSMTITQGLDYRRL